VVVIVHLGQETRVVLAGDKSCKGRHGSRLVEAAVGIVRYKCSRIDFFVAPVCSLQSEGDQKHHDDDERSGAEASVLHS